MNTLHLNRLNRRHRKGVFFIGTEVEKDFSLAAAAAAAKVVSEFIRLVSFCTRIHTHTHTHTCTDKKERCIYQAGGGTGRNFDVIRNR